jgi:hypothetical protein
MTMHDAVRERVDTVRLASVLYTRYREGHQRADSHRPVWADLKPETQLLWESAVRESLGPITEAVVEALEAEGWTVEPTKPAAETFGGDGSYTIQHAVGVTAVPPDDARAWVLGYLEGMGKMLPKVRDLNTVRQQLAQGLRDAADRLRARANAPWALTHADLQRPPGCDLHPFGPDPGCPDCCPPEATGAPE